MSQAVPDRIDRLEAMIQSLANTSENLLTVSRSLTQAQQNHEARLQRLEDGQLALQELGGLLAGETRQLKRAVDYLLSKDGERDYPDESQ